MHTALFQAVRDGNLEAVKRLVKNDLRLLSARDPLRNDRTPLILACYYQKTRVVRYLLDQGADVDARNRHGKTAAHYVCMNGSSIILQLLLEKGADVTLRDEEGYTPLMYAAFYAREQVLRTLLKLPAATVAATVDERLTHDVLHVGKTALMLAAFKHFTQGVRLLLEEGGANPYVTDDRGRTALDLVCFLGRNDKVRVMEGMLLNAMREPERALALHKARVLAEVPLCLAPSVPTPTAAAEVEGEGKVKGAKEEEIKSTEGEGERMRAMVPQCLQARLVQEQPLPLVSVSDPLTTQAQEPGMGRAAFLALRRTGELREAVVQFVVGGALPDDLYKELQGYLRTEWAGSEGMDESRTPSALVRAASATALAAQAAAAQAAAQAQAQATVVDTTTAAVAAAVAIGELPPPAAAPAAVVVGAD